MTKTETNPAAIVDRRYDFVFLFDVTDGNPNGDPDAGNMPRLDPQTMQGLVTDGCLKRKIRNAVAVMKQGTAGEVDAGFDLYFQTQDAVFEKRILNLIHQRAYTDSGADVKKKGKEKVAEIGKARKWMCTNFYDIRAFGAVMTTGEGEDKHNCGQVRGPVQITFARSIDPIVPLEFAITRKSVTKLSDAEREISEKGTLTGTMGRKNTVPYGMYRSHGFINPFLARDTGFTYADLELLWQALTGTMWEIDRSASRGLMATRGLYVFEHSSSLGNAPAHELFNRIDIQPLSKETDIPAPRQFADYQSRIHLRDGDLPNGVVLRRLVG